MFWWDKEAGQQRSRSIKRLRADLGRTKSEQKAAAERLGAMFIEQMAVVKAEGASMPQPSSGPLTLKALATKYEDEGFAGRTAGYKRDSLAAIRS